MTHPYLRPAIVSLSALLAATSALAVGIGGPVRPPAAAEFPIPFYEGSRPLFRTTKTGNTVFELSPVPVSDLPVAGEGISIKLQPTHARGAHALQLTWDLEPGSADWSKGDGLELWFRAATGDAFDFVDEIGVVGTRFRFELTDGKGNKAHSVSYIRPENWGEWQRLHLRLRFGARWDAKLDRTDIRRVTLTIPAIREKAFGFSLAGFGVYRESDYSGPTLAIHVRPMHLVITPEEAFSFTVEVRGIPTGETAQVVVQAQEVFGATEEKTFDLVSTGRDLNLLSSSSTFFPNRGQGHLDFTATLRYGDRDVYRTRWMMGSLPAAPRPTTAMPWGFWPGAGPDAELLGAAWTRLRIGLRRLADTAYDGLPPLDNGEWRVVHHAPRGLRSIAYFSGYPDEVWKNPERPNWSGGMDWEKYGKLVEEAVRRCKAAGIRFYEVINEPNTAGGPSIEQLVELHRVTYEAVKRVDPEARVMGPSPYLLSVSYIERFFTAGGARWIDDLAMHAYNSNDETLDAIPRLRKLMDDHGRKDGGIYITEVGVNSPPYSPARQAQLTVQRNIILFSQGVKAITWHGLGQWGWERSLTADEPDVSFMTMTYGGEPMPAFIAYGMMTRILGECVPAGIVETPLGSRGFRFESNKKTVEVLWSESSKPIEVTRPASSSSSLLNLMGQPLPIKTNNDLASFALTGMPVYLVTPKSPIASP